MASRPLPRTGFRPARRCLSTRRSWPLTAAMLVSPFRKMRRLSCRALRARTAPRAPARRGTRRKGSRVMAGVPAETLHQVVAILTPQERTLIEEKAIREAVREAFTDEYARTPAETAVGARIAELERKLQAMVDRWNER